MAIISEPSPQSGPFEAAGLPAEDVRSWLKGSPEFCAGAGSSDEIALSARRLADFCEPGEAFLRHLPPKSARNPKQAAAAEALKEEARQARTRFLRAHVEPVYRALTHDYAEFIRVDDLVRAAAERFPGLAPSATALARERQLALKDKEGIEIDHGILLSQILAQRDCGLHLVHAMLRPTREAEELLPRFRSEGFLDLGPVRVARMGNAGHVTLRNAAYLNAEDESTVLPMETAVDLVLLDPDLEIGVLRGDVVQHAKYSGRRVFNAGINLTHLYYGRISFVDFYIVRDLGFMNKFYRGLSGPEFLPNEPECSLEKPWLGAVEAFAIGGGCQILLTLDHVIAERTAFFNLPARKEGIIPGAANLRLPRAVGDRLARQGILSGRSFPADSPAGALLCDEVVEPDAMDAAIEQAVARLSSAGVVSVAANRKAMRVGQESLDTFRQYMATYAREQAYCHFSPALVRNLEDNWNARSRSADKAGRPAPDEPSR
jgi:(3,5-dihydroxyphenyl)acetyl-CoA 1,2-dioxygenase